MNEEAPKQPQDLALITAIHDMTNPVSAIFGYADMLLETDAGNSLSPEQRAVILRIRRTSSRAIELVKNYQILNELSEDLPVLSESRCDLNKIVRDVVDCTYRKSEDLPELMLVLDEQQISIHGARIAVDRIFSNLLTNALRYTPLTGHIQVFTVKKSDSAVLIVRNSDTVIPQEELPNIFNKDVRCSASKDLPGTGLGLYIVKALVEKLGGSISVESHLPEGTTFTARFQMVS